MKKLIFLPLIIVISLSCDNQTSKLIKIDEPAILSEEQSFEIVNSNEYTAYFSLRYKFLKLVKTALNNGYSVENLTEISIGSISKNDHETFYKTIFNDYSKGVEYVEKLKEAQIKLYTKFPILNTINPESEPNLTESQVSVFYTNLEAVAIESGGSFSNEVTNGIVCGSYWQQVKLLRCAGLCGAATAGAGAILCGWACGCMLCTENSSV